MIFDVAIWQVWSYTRDRYISTPEIEEIDAPNAFTAVEQVMRSCGLYAAGHVAAAAKDRTIVYRGYGVRLTRRGGVETAKPGERSSSILESLRHGGVSPGWSKRRPRLGP